MSTTALRWSAGARRPPLRPGDAASVVVTSGSTGTPKGVVLSHTKVVDGALSAADLLGAADGSRVGAVAPPAFAMGQTAVFAALLSGASLHLHDPRVHGTRSLAAFLADHRVETTWVAPSLLRALSGPQGRPLPGLRRVVCGGEPLQGAEVLRARAALGAHLEVVNCLGSSETWHTAPRVLLPADPVPAGPVPPGDALPGVVLVVVDDVGAVLPDGATGLLRVRSAVLASGYLAGPDDAFTTRDGWVRFTTSDSPAAAPTGRWSCGRADDALKVRGYLVEPAEVERVLRAQEGVTDAAVVVHRDGSTPRLVACAAVPLPLPVPRRTVWRGRVGAVRALAGLRRGDGAARWMEDLDMRTSRLHRRRPWPGRALVFRSHLNPDCARAWDAVLLGEVVVRTLPADHGSVLRQPHVAAVAAALAAEVDRAGELRPAGWRSVRPGA